MTVNVGGSLSTRERLLEALHLEEEERDLLLVCGDSSVVKCHQVMLSLHSTFLRDLFSQRACCSCRSLSCGGLKELTLHLESFDKKTVLTLVEYLYTGECKVQDRQTFMELLQLKSSLCLDIEIDPLPLPEREPSPGLVSARESQKRLTVEIVTAIEEINSGASSVLCSECHQILGKETFLLHYRNHMQSYSQIMQELEETKSNSEDQMMERTKSEEVSELCLQTCTNSDNESDNEIDLSPSEPADDQEEESLGVTDIDMEEYEKLLRAHIHSSILRRKRKMAKGTKVLILVSQQEVEEEIRKVPRNKTEEYAKLKVKKIVKNLSERKGRNQPKSAFVPSMISDEEIMEVIERENKSRKIKLVLDINRARSRNCQADPGDADILQTERRGDGCSNGGNSKRAESLK